MFKMSDLAYVFLSGRLTRDVEFKTLPGGANKATFGIAINSNFKKGDEWQKKTTFLDIVAWKNQADYVNKAGLAKGDQVTVVGTLDTEEWKSKDGKDVKKIVVVLREISFVGGKKKEVSNEDSDNGTPF